jgi:hypothetical protein
MDSQKKVLFGSLAVFALVTAGIMYWLLKVRSVEIAKIDASPSASSNPSENKAAATKAEPPQAVFTAKEIDFKQTLQIEDKAIIIDGGEAVKVPCEAVPQLFGFVKIDADVTGELTCKDDYMGGIQLKVKDASGEDHAVDLEQADGDAGDSWDSRSLLSREKDGRLRIDLISVSSSENIEDEKSTPSCSLRETALTWDPATKSFLGANPSGLFNLKMFRSDISVSESCLDEQGDFKAQ